MAQTITDIVGKDEPDAVIATTITSYALSSVMTGAVFYFMGKFNFGYMVGFIPRHILIGCIGGVGWFLVATGFEVSARLSGSLEYNLETLRELFQPDTLPLWAFPLVLAIVLFYGQSKVASKYFLPLYIIAIPAIFYFFVAVIEPLNVDHLRDNGWIFEGPPADEPWWYFWTLYSEFAIRRLPTIPRRSQPLTNKHQRISPSAMGCRGGDSTSYAGAHVLWNSACPHQCARPGVADG